MGKEYRTQKTFLYRTVPYGIYGKKKEQKMWAISCSERISEHFNFLSSLHFQLLPLSLEHVRTYVE